MLKLAASKIGLIGLGAMGSGIAICIARAGLPLSVYDSDEEKISAATSSPLIVKNTPNTILTECDLILFCVPSASQIDSVLSIAPPKSLLVVPVFEVGL